MAKLENTLMAKTDALENVRSADTRESIEDDHGMAAYRKKRARGGKVVEGKKARSRMDRAPKAHPDAAQDRALIKSMVKPADLKKDAKPAYAKGGAVKSKGKTTVNVIIAPQGGGAGGPPSGSMPPPSGAMPPPPPRPPMAPPPGMAPPGAGGPPGVPPGAGPAMGRKDGGRVYPISDGAGGGEGRLQKDRAYGKNARSGEGK